MTIVGALAGPHGLLPPALDKQRLGQLIDLVSNIQVGDEDARSRDVLGRVYEYSLSQFASAEGKKGGEFYTPRCVVKVLVEMLEPYQGRVYDPCCGSSGMFVQSIAFIRAHASGNGNGGTATVTRCGRICYDRKKINLSTVFAGQNVGVTQVSEHIWLVSVMHYDLGYFDHETCRLEPIENPFSPKVLPMSSE